MQRSLTYGLYGAVLAGLIGAPVAWSSVDKTVHLVVDGRDRAVSTSAADVAGVLAAAGYSAGPHDLLAPGANTAVHNGSRIVLRRGRLLNLRVDGQDTRVWTTAPTVADALGQLGYPESDSVSVSRSQRLPLTPTTIDLRTPLLLTVVHDGIRQQVSTTASSVGQLLDDLDVPMSPTDRVSVPMASAPRGGEVVRITRVNRTQITRLERVPFPVARIADPKLAAGRTEIVTPGRAGSMQVTYVVVYVDGRFDGKTRLGARLLARARKQIVRIGTKINLVAVGGRNPSAAAEQAYARSLLPSFGWSDVDTEMSCLVTMWNHESGWRVDAANPSGAYGIPQALPGAKMSSAGPNWQNDAATQIKWGLGYIRSRYGSPCGAWSFWQQGSWY